MSITVTFEQQRSEGRCKGRTRRRRGPFGLNPPPSPSSHQFLIIVDKQTTSRLENYFFSRQRYAEKRRKTKLAGHDERCPAYKTTTANFGGSQIKHNASRSSVKRTTRLRDWSTGKGRRVNGRGESKRKPGITNQRWRAGFKTVGEVSFKNEWTSEKWERGRYIYI